MPGGGPALDGSRWVETRHPRQRNRRQPYLTDNIELGHDFREQFLAGLKRLVSSGKLKLEGPWARLKDPRALQAWLDALTATDWNVFIEGPPHGHSRPRHVIGYLARYLTGGPIADRRIIREQDGRIVFWARSTNRARGNHSRPFSLPGKELVRRWSMHILPKGYTRSRQYGGYHGRKRAAYLAACRQLLSLLARSDVARDDERGWETQSAAKCPRCDVVLRCLDRQRRPSWKVIFQRRVYADGQLYCPLLHVLSRGPPAFSRGTHRRHLD